MELFCEALRQEAVRTRIPFETLSASLVEQLTKFTEQINLVEMNK